MSYNTPISHEDKAAELRAIDAVHEALVPLSVHARVRVLQWATHWAKCEQPNSMTVSDPCAL